MKVGTPAVVAEHNRLTHIFNEISFSPAEFVQMMTAK